MDIRKTEKNKVDNAVIMAAGFSSRFSPLSFEWPKALLRVKGEILIERQIRQLQEAGISDITIVVGYKKELFYYLKEKLQVEIVENPEYDIRNNNSSIYYVKDILANTYICSADNYFTENIFKAYVDKAYYSTIYEKGSTDEWCFLVDENDLIKDVQVGGRDAWIMIGPAFFTRDFSKRFVQILEDVYNCPETQWLFWEDIYINNIEKLAMYIGKFDKEIIFEFDALDELREFDESYWENSGSKILEKISKKLKCRESDIIGSRPIINNRETIGFKFFIKDKEYKYDYKTKTLVELE